ncbi:Crp/Fnr family transcriptional regulator [Azospirillum sp. TSO22-1]|uniref:Crp/Fnr family transcriptional regulator n=1 Tax=Azospirillum sp. TSO22-1 TaxID=716789 RepID=UPI001304EC8F|nr:Crp/Fnr family transcriptional regulator [Azospirillum sp. TSO22-1]
MAALDSLLLPDDTLLAEAGTSITHLHLIRSGLVALMRDLPDGSRRILRLLKPGDIIGLEGLTGAPQPHRAVALRESALCRVPVGAVQEAADASPAFARRLLDHWRTALERADMVILDFGHGSARQRVARLLLFLAAPSDGRCATFRRGDMAAVLDLAPETVSRVLTGFQRGGILVKRDPNHFQADRAALRAEAELP